MHNGSFAFTTMATSDSDDDNEDFLFNVESDLFEIKGSEEEKQIEHRLLLEKRRSCRSLVSEAKGNGKNGESVYILANGTQIGWLDEVGNQQGQAWECSLRLCNALEQRANTLSGARVIELGCGLGIPGLCSARLGASSVLLTDVPDSLRPAQAAIERNLLQDKVVTHPLLWGDCNSLEEALHVLRTFEQSHGIQAKEMFDVILCSDLIYGDSEPARMLVDTLIQLTHENTLVLSLHEKRLTGDQGESFFDSLERSSTFTFQVVDWEEIGISKEESQFFSLTEIRRRR